jgi:hypothetical protein
MTKNYKHVPLILIVLMVALQLNLATAQNVGIGTATPTEKLDVFGNLKFTGALMPNNNAGTTGRILMSAGPNVAPTWGPPLLNPVATTNIGKFYVNNVNLPANSIITLTVADPNCVPGSCIVPSFVGVIPGTAAQVANLRIYNVETQTGQFIMRVANQNSPNPSYTGLSIAYIAFY